MEKKAVVAGHICLDIIPEVEHPFDLVPGRLYEVGAPAMATGGAVSNTGLAMHVLGVPVLLMGKVGADNFGDLILNVVKKQAPGLEKGMTVDKNSISSYTVVVNIPGTDRIFLHCPGANGTYVASDVNWSAAEEASLFHFGYPCFMSSIYAKQGAELKKMYRHAKELGLTTSMDPGMPDGNGPAGKVDWEQLLRDVLPDVDVFMPSADELLYMIDREHFGEGDNISAEELHVLGTRLLNMGTAVAAIKLGKRGMYVKTASLERISAMGKAKPENPELWADREYIFPVFTPAKFMGATGAGDASIGGFLSALLKNLSLEEAGILAAAVGACNVEAPDSLGGLRNWEDTMARIHSGWTSTAMQIDEPAWTLRDGNIWMFTEN